MIWFICIKRIGSIIDDDFISAKPMLLFGSRPIPEGLNVYRIFDSIKCTTPEGSNVANYLVFRFFYLLLPILKP